ncbi:MAG TPA: segregation/condensation protein A, partial [candidate division Zixibacteria bacterium]|nr:segregation/condensation protein A [candidate division Zixibacteria bacterium]
MKELNLEVAGEFVVMAATLIHIKVRLLLPRDPDQAEEDDPREELIMALLEYKKYREASEILREKAIMEERYFVPELPVGRPDLKVDLSPGTTLFDLLTAFREVLANRSDEQVHRVDTFEVSIEDRIGHVMRILRGREAVAFRELFADLPRRIVAVVTFIALLELVRTRRIAIDQSEPFRELRVYRGEQFDAPQREIDIVDFSRLEVQAAG